MPQTSIATYFHTRKRAATDDGLQLKNTKVRKLDNNDGTILKNSKSDLAAEVESVVYGVPSVVESAPVARKQTRTTAKAKKTVKVISKKSKTNDAAAKPANENLVKFIRKGLLSPNKLTRLASPVKGTTDPVPDVEKQTATPVNANQAVEQSNAEQRGMVTPVKNAVKTPVASTSKASDLVNMPLDQVKRKLNMSDRMAELKNRLNTLQRGFEQADRLEQSRKQMATPKKNIELNKEILGCSPTLKRFDKMEIEVISPMKKNQTPTKPSETTPQKNLLMSPTKDAPTTPKNRRLFSPTKTPKKAPAYQRYQHLTDDSQSTLPLPHTYRCLLEIFRGVDTICSMYHKRNEQITYKKLRPAVKNMIRMDLTESHLAQIKHLYPDAYEFRREKVRNYASETKYETWQLVIIPIVDIKQETAAVESKSTTEENLIKAADKHAMGPVVLLERLNKMRNKLLDLVRDEHEKFLSQLKPPMVVDRLKLTRWHPEFELDKCPKVKTSPLPKPPQAETYSNAQDTLNIAARNLFGCATPMEKALERLEQKKKSDEMAGIEPIPQEQPKLVNNKNILKNIPASLLEKIRKKEAAKALALMTRRPSQDREAASYSHLPELARHLRNIFITEKKGVLLLSTVIGKIINSYKGGLNEIQLEEHLKLIEKEMPTLISIQVVRQQKYLKFSKNENIAEVVRKLEQIAKEKSM